MPRNHDMIAIDLDGTLLCPRGQVSDRNRRAILDARRDGVLVTVCTGRGWVECRSVARTIEQRDPVVVAGGAILSCPVRERTLHRFSMPFDLTRAIVSTIVAHGHAAMILKDPDGTIDPSSPESQQGHDYVVVSPHGRSGVSPITLWWFDEYDVKHRIVESLDDDEHPKHTVRVGVCGPRRQTTAVADAIRTEFAGLAAMHHFGAVTPGHEQAAKDAGMTGDEDVLIFEAFHPDTDKWTAVSWLARQRDIDPRRICAIGNDVNDLGMLRAAGLGVAMANAIPQAREAARKHTLANDADGVAHAIERVLSGEW